MRRYRDAAAFALATLGVQAGVTALLELALSFGGVYPSLVKRGAIGLLGAAAGWRGSWLGMLAIVAVSVTWYGAIALLSQPEAAFLDVVRVTVVFIAVTGAGFMIGRWIRHGRATTGSISTTNPAG